MPGKKVEGDDKYKMVYLDIKKPCYTCFQGMSCYYSYEKLVSHLVEFSDNLLGQELLQVVPEFKGVNGHDFCASPLPHIPGEEGRLQKR